MHALPSLNHSLQTIVHAPLKFTDAYHFLLKQHVRGSNECNPAPKSNRQWRS